MKVTKYKVEKSEIVYDNRLESISKAVKEGDVDTVEQIFDKLRSDMKDGEIKVFSEDNHNMLFIYKNKFITMLFNDDIKCIRGNWRRGSMQIWFRDPDLEKIYWRLMRDKIYTYM